MKHFILPGILLLIILYQQFRFQYGIQNKLKQLNLQLADILSKNSDERVMLFTDLPILKELMASINCLLTDRQRLKIEFLETEETSKKMLSNISHDIKTPLTVVLGYLEILRLHDPKNKALEKTEEKANQVMNLINEFFTLAKLESGDMKLEQTKLNINELCRKNILDFYDILLQKDFEVEVSIPEESIFIEGDENAINRILFNLLSNAIRYGGDGKYIGLFLKTDGAYVMIDIVDKGKGIEQASIPHVFDRLYTMEDSRSRSVQGNDLGLTIAKHLAIQMNGDILLYSQPKIQTLFCVKFKIAVPPYTPVEPLPLP